MAEFELIRDEKITMWRRHFCRVKAETEEEAIRILSGEDDPWGVFDSCNGVEITDTEDLYDTVDLVPVGEDENDYTVEVMKRNAQYSWNHDTLWLNEQSSSDTVSLYRYQYVDKAYVKISAFEPSEKSTTNNFDSSVGSLPRTAALEFIKNIEERYPNCQVPDISTLRFLFNIFIAEYAQNTQSQ